MAQIRRWHVYPSAEALAERAAAAILRIAREAIAARGRFTIVLAGGTTPQRVYAALARSDADWGRWHVYFGDERCVAVGHPERNDAMARSVWLGRVDIAQAQIYPMPAERGPKEGAAHYAPLIQGIDAFDLVLLGLGEDGHTASLFPDGPGIAERGADTIAVTGAPKPPPDRISLSAARLSRAREVLFLVAGAGKRAAVSAWEAGEDLPAAHIAPPHGVDILIDGEAWPEKRSA